ncbi:MAG: GGDEF domain-containing protein [Lachnospiraceae bacterium]|nr:GGDEF domain-containing protein [Lachnospiraceae bacterium]
MARNKHKKNRSGDRFRVFQIELLVVFAAILLVVTAILDFAILGLSGRVLKRTASDLIAANSRQLELNINSYLERTETLATLLFSDETFYLYDETDESISDYDKIKYEEKIRDRIVDIGLMENYSDFGIIYADDHKVGWISHGTQDLFPEGGFYDAFSGYIVNHKKNDGWCFGVGGNTDRMYYVKRLNKNAILVSAIYTRELSSVFIYPEQLEGMTIRLVNQEDDIMFSSDFSEIGQKLPTEIAENLGGGNSDYIVNSNVCSNDWRVVCSVPTKIILRENIKQRRIALLISVVMAGIFLIIGLLIFTKVSRPMGGMVDSLQKKAEIDKLSGVMNKATFEESVVNRLADPEEDRVHVFVMLDVDNFKQVNDKLGHAYGDEVIIREGKLLRRLHDESTMIGRLGGDEFALYTECRGMEKSKVTNAVKEQMDKVLEEFLKEFEKEHEQCGISVSAGVYVCDKQGIGFQELYSQADQALYTSKKAGKSQYTLKEYA